MKNFHEINRTFTVKKKFYSFLLLATTLLFSTNAWAAFTINGGATEYANLKTACTAASDGDVIHMTANTSLSSTSANNCITKAITLDLGGYTLTIANDNIYLAIQTNGVTVQNGVIRSANKVKYGLIRLINGSAPSIALENVALSSTSTAGTYYLITSESGVTATISMDADCSIAADNRAGVLANEGVATFSTYLSNPSIKSTAALTYTNHGTCTISGGSFNALTINNEGTFIIEGGTFAGDVVFGGSNAVTVRDADYNFATFDGTISGSTAPVLQGGLYAQGLGGFSPAAGYADVEVVGGHRVLPAGANRVQIVGGSSFYYLEDAFAAATDGQTIKLLNHVSTPSQIILADDRQLTLDLAGFNITGDFGGTSLKSNRKGMFLLYRGNLDITGNGTIENTALGGHAFNVAGVNYHVGVDGYDENIHKNWSTLTIGSGVTVKGGTNGIYVCIMGSVMPWLFPEANQATNTYGYHPTISLKNCAYGVTVTVNGKVNGGIYGIQIDGNIKSGPTGPGESENDNYPRITIGSTAEIWSLPSDVRSTAIYAAGYGVWDIQGGEIHGSTGVYVKSGDVDIQDAHIYSENETFTDATGKASGIDASGCAIVLESNASYKGNMEMAISGNTVVEATSGYAIQDVNTTAQNKVYDLTITGGEYIGGDDVQGCVVMTAELQDVVLTNKSIEGGTYSSDIDMYLDQTSGIVSQTTNEEGELIYVVGVKPSDSDPWSLDINVDKPSTAYVKWERDTAVTLTADAAVRYFAMEANSTLTIPEGKTLHAGSIVMGADAAIIVEPGGVLVLDSAAGLVANQVGNIVLKANFEKAGYLLMSPDVESNMQPKATVQLATPEAYKMDANNNHWQRFASPMIALEGFASDRATVSHILYPGETSLLTKLMYWNYNTGGWADLNYANAKPFVSYFISNNRDMSDNASNPDGVVYTMKGRLQGSINSNIAVQGIGFNYMGNSFTAPMGVGALLTQIEANAIPDLDITVYVFDPSTQTFKDVTPTNINFSSRANYQAVKPLDAFVLHLGEEATQAGSVNANYNATVWDYNMAAPSPAPARRNTISNQTTAVIAFEAENGMKDEVILIEGNDFTANFDNGADAHKFMNENYMNVYADGKLSTVATDNIDGTMLSLETRDASIYTMSFSDVEGETLYIKDLQNGIVTEISEGNTYQFVAQSNADVKNRFQIISSKNAPTALDEVSAAHAAKGIYTVLGQYLGASDELDKLPKGVYVVDGVKIVK
ncbi:MAG: hypothetical protein II827_04680 [Paludibacteraceae bacterium]|nr:hypothetical protein [Paludibacteraceae bacterium]